ncbi:cleavage and polyadenylation specificity factor subunit 6-like isoform X2 [Mya arenaria]|uniref:cleavage and polyadenylation specificity factor subunit 6-like isoform X2 n=1 Tax=Mya arenaria TaxID=6604 RepID=UPI0022E16502|nr:cleavage and polyadenylation specificity factor subunit 6-like isoform X2 [Mya arenaria]XP_052798826.1 cleavage and polyadenylation specificity factor subunit 6-like isoform X2 [Mya arenaria]
MADSVDIDLYENIEEGFDQDGEFGQDADLYDDVIITQSSSSDHKELITNTSLSDEPKKNIIPPTSVPASYTGRRYSVYVGNLQWWTTDQDLTDALAAVGVNDLLEIKFYENRANGQSKGFAIVIVKSETSSRAIFDKLPRKELQGQTPLVTHCNKQALNNFEAQARKGEPPPQQNGRGRTDSRGDAQQRPDAQRSAPPPTQTQRPPQSGARPAAPFPQRPTGPPPMSGPPPTQGPPPPTSGPPPNFFPHGMPPVSMPPVSMAPGVGLVRPMTGPPPGMMPRGVPDPRLPPPGIRPGMPPGPAPFAVRGQMPPQPVPPPGIRGLAPSIPGMHHPRMPPTQPPPGVPPPGHHPVAPPAPHVNPAFFAPTHPPSLPPPVSHAPPSADPYGRPPPSTVYPGTDPYRTERRSEPAAPALSEQEFEEIFQRNKTVSSSAISRAVQDASAGDFASAIETLVTAISLIKQSKIANDDRCKILISSLQDTLHGIEEKSYGSNLNRSKNSGEVTEFNQNRLKNSGQVTEFKSRERRSRSRERDREREREKRSRHRSRSRERDYRERSRERERREYDERHREGREGRDRRESDRERDREREYRSSRH